MFWDLNFSHNSPALVACIIYFVDSCFRYFVCGKYCDQGQLEKKGFILPYGSRGMRIYHGGESWQQVVVMALGEGSSWPTS